MASGYCHHCGYQGELTTHACESILKMRLETLSKVKEQIVELHNAFHDVHDLLYDVTRHNKQCRGCGFYGGLSHKGGCPVQAIEELVSG